MVQPTSFESLLSTARNLLTGEPIRAIGYGAIAVVFLVTRLAVLVGYAESAPDLDTILGAVAAAVTAITEISRRFTFSPNTVEAIVEELDPGAPAPQPPDGEPVL